MMDISRDERFMRMAIQEAQKAADKGEVPVGAVIVYEKKVLARAHNLCVQLNDPTAHAEMQAITAACDAVGSRYLDQCTLYVTLEPCAMCAGAMFWSQLGELVYGASDPKRGYSQNSGLLLHPGTKITTATLESESAQLLRQFFLHLRKQNEN